MSHRSRSVRTAYDIPMSKQKLQLLYHALLSHAAYLLAGARRPYYWISSTFAARLSPKYLPRLIRTVTYVVTWEDALLPTCVYP